MLPADVCERALNARDARFDGIFFVGIITTRVYCRPVCPARVSYHDHRRFFDTAASAERAGFRPCLRCRPELAPGRATVDAVPRLAWVAAQRIGAGALNGGDVTQLARELGVSDRHLRRALQRELGVSPAELAQTHRLLLAKRLLADTSLSVTHIAFASGFQSLRRFNAAFRERYRLSPSELQRPPRPAKATRIASRNTATPTAPANDFIRLTLAYRAPLAWDVLMAVLRREAIPGVEEVVNGSYRRTVRINERSGVVIAEDATDTAYGPARMAGSHLNVDVSLSLLPVLMPLLARLRQLFDLDAEPSVVDAHLEQAGLGTLVRQRPGVRMPGAVDGFEVALRSLLGASGAATSQLAQRVAWALGEPLDTGLPTLTRLAPSAARVAEAGASRLESLGVPPARALAIDATARRLADGSLRLAPGDDVRAAHRALLEIEGVDDRLAAAIVMRALRWPDAFPSSDGSLQRAAGAANPKALREKAEDWRPWRGYAAMHLWLQDDEV